jgi:uncharacterized protein (UPF0297 family)
MNKNKSKYSSCGLITILFIIIATFAAIYAGKNELGYPVLIFIGFCIVGGILDVFVSTIIKNKKKNIKENTTNEAGFQENVLDVQGLELQKHISEDFFNNINNITNELVSILKKTENDTEFHHIMKYKQYAWKLNDSILDMSYDISANTIASHGIDKKIKPTIMEEIRALFLFDLIQCYLKLNYSTDFNTVRGFGLLVFLEKTMDFDTNDYKNLDRIIRYRQQINKLFSKQIENCKRPDSEALLDTRFFISEIFRWYNPDLQQSYVKLMCLFCGIITNTIDSTPDENSKQWLAEIDSVYGFFDKLYTTKNKVFHFEKDPLLEEVMRYVQKNHKVFSEASDIASHFNIETNRIRKIKEQLIEMGIIHKERGYKLGANIIIKSPIALERFFKTTEFKNI